MVTEDILPDNSALVTIQLEDNTSKTIWMSYEEYLRWQEFCKNI